MTRSELSEELKILPEALRKAYEQSCIDNNHFLLCGLAGTGTAFAYKLLILMEIADNNSRKIIIFDDQGDLKCVAEEFGANILSINDLNGTLLEGFSYILYNSDNLKQQPDINKKMYDLIAEMEDNYTVFFSTLGNLSRVGDVAKLLRKDNIRIVFREYDLDHYTDEILNLIPYAVLLSISASDRKLAGKIYDIPDDFLKEITGREPLRGIIHGPLGNDKMALKNTNKWKMYNILASVPNDID